MSPNLSLIVSRDLIENVIIAQKILWPVSMGPVPASKQRGSDLVLTQPVNMS